MLNIRKIKTALVILAVWIFNGIYFSSFKYYASEPSPLSALLGYGSGIAPLPIIILTTLTGLVIAGVEIFVSEIKGLRMTLGKLILIKAGLYFTGFIFLSMSFVGYLRYTNHNLYSFRQAAVYSLQIFNSDILFVFISMLLVFAAVLLFIHANSKLTPRHFLHYVFGKYHLPKIENRIFMFLDLKSSTTIAEKLGAVKYHEFLYDFYYMITDPIISRNGEIYQYVGDEISVTWKLKTGIKDNNCINCFFDIEDVIERNAAFYMEKYGFKPEFKAGFHYGETVIGEIGVIKSEIVFSGDVVNTTARIQELCNHYKQRLLVSRETLDILNLNTEFIVDQMDSIKLRGKETETLIYSVTKRIKELAA
jgi:adenylate cyclase